MPPPTLQTMTHKQKRTSETPPIILADTIACEDSERASAYFAEINDEEDEDDDNPIYEGAFVRLTGLKAVALNGKVGTVIFLDCASERFGVFLAGDVAPKAIKRPNLASYSSRQEDMCSLEQEDSSSSD